MLLQRGRVSDDRTTPPSFLPGGGTCGGNSSTLHWNVEIWVIVIFDARQESCCISLSLTGPLKVHLQLGAVCLSWPSGPGQGHHIVEMKTLF